MIRTEQDFDICRDGDRVGINLLFDVPSVSKSSKYPPLTDAQINALTILRINNTTVYDKNGRWLIKAYTQQIADDLLQAVLDAAKWLDANCPPQIAGEHSPHIGWWRWYALEIFLSKDARVGANEFCELPGVPEFFNEIDHIFFNADRNMCKIFRDVRPGGERICGSSFLMAVVNSGGSGPHVDGEDWADGCCCVAPFGSNWTGGELVFRHLGLGFELRPGDVIFFRSAELVHENLPSQGDRRSIVLTTDRNSFTGRGQPLEPSKVADIEAALLGIRASYNQLSDSAKRQLLGERVRRRLKDEQERQERLKREASMKAIDIVRSRLVNKTAPTARTNTSLLTDKPHVTTFLAQRLNNKMAPIRHKPRKWELESTPSRASKRTSLPTSEYTSAKGANSQARKQQHVKTKK